MSKFHNFPSLSHDTWMLLPHQCEYNTPLPHLVEKLLFACSLLSFTEDLVLVIFTTLAAILRANIARDREVQAQMMYHFLQHLDRSGCGNVSYLRQQFNDYKETIEEAAKLEPVRKTLPNIKYLGQSFISSPPALWVTGKLSPCSTLEMVSHGLRGIWNRMSSTMFQIPWVKLLPLHEIWAKLYLIVISPISQQNWRCLVWGKRSSS